MAFTVLGTLSHWMALLTKVHAAVAPSNCTFAVARLAPGAGPLCQKTTSLRLPTRVHMSARGIESTCPGPSFQSGHDGVAPDAAHVVTGVPSIAQSFVTMQLEKAE
jgi:hypothetical protein